MSSSPLNGGPRLVTETNPRVLAAFARIETMTDDQIRELVRHEQPIFFEAGEALIAERHAAGHSSTPRS